MVILGSFLYIELPKYIGSLYIELLNGNIRQFLIYRAS